MPQDPQVILQDPSTGSALGYLYVDANDDVAIQHANSATEVLITSDGIDVDGNDVTNANTLQVNDAAANPANPGEIQRNGSDLLAYINGSAQSLLGSGSAIILDLGDDGANESADLNEIATSNDANNVFTEPSSNKLLVDLSKNWPTADTVASDAIGENELDLSITPAWTGLHTFNAGIDIGSSGASPAQGAFTYDGTDVFVGTGGGTKNLSDIGSGGGGSADTSTRAEKVMVEDGDKVVTPIAVPDTQTVTVKHWGFSESDRSALPSNMTIDLVDPQGNVIAFENTKYTANPSGASEQNTSGSVSYYALELKNNTGNDYIAGQSPDGVFIDLKWEVA